MEFKSYKDTLDTLLKGAIVWDRYERIPISHAKGRIVCENIKARQDYPLFCTSAMDGYACKFSDQILKKLKIIGSLPAGNSPRNIILHNSECLKTFTGSLMCNGSDTLIPIENVKVVDDSIEIISPASKGFAIRPAGESYKKGEVLIKKGSKLDYSELGLLAELGISYVNVFIQPKVAVLSTGSEIVDIGEVMTNEAQIHSSNHIAIANMISSMNCQSIILPIIKDDENLLKNAIKNTLKSVDILITTGGVSVGDFDFMRDILRDECQIIVNGAFTKPGRHIKIARIGEKYIFALPGFPYSAMVTCALYFREFINKILHTNETYSYKAVLTEDYIKKTKFEEFSAAEIKNDNGILKISTSTKKSGSSAIVSNLNNKAVLLNCPADKNKLEKGQIVDFIVMV